MAPKKDDSFPRLRRLGETADEYEQAKIVAAAAAVAAARKASSRSSKVETKASVIMANGSNSQATVVHPQPGEALSPGTKRPAVKKSLRPVMLTLQGQSSVGDDGRLRPLLRDPGLAVAAEIVNDLERTRIANQNRLRVMTSSEPDEDGVVRGWGLTMEHAQVLPVLELVDNLQRLEDVAVKNLQKLMRKHPLGAWGRAQRGVGEKQLARLLSSIGDPFVHDLLGRPRSVSELWAYSGYHVVFPSSQAGADDPSSTAAGEQASGGHISSGNQTEAVPGEPVVGVAARRRRGQRANWSPGAKMRAYLIAESCVKQIVADCKEAGTHEFDEAPAEDGSGDIIFTQACACSPYRVEYDERKAHTRETHPDWTDGHRHNDALRIAAKEMLKDLWVAARDWHVSNGFDVEKFQETYEPPVIEE